MEKERPISVAVIGSGMAGLVTAYLLQHDPKQRYRVKVYESSSSLSLDAASVSIPNTSRTSSCRVDLPMRAFAGGFYNNLKSMYDHLGIKYRSQPFLFEFARVLKDASRWASSKSDAPYFIHPSNLHKLPPRPTDLDRISYIVEILYLLACYAWFSLCCFWVTPRNQHDVCESLDQYLQRIRLPRYFTFFYLLPLISSVTTCPHNALLAFPASDLVEYKRRTNGAPHYTVSNGVKTVQDKLVEGIECELSAVVTKVVLEGSELAIQWKKVDGSDATCRRDIFNRVVLAVAPNVVGSVYHPLQRHMAKIPTTPVQSVVHTDRKLLGNRSPSELVINDAQLIYLRTSMNDVPRTESLHVQPCGAVVTTCPFSPIDPSLIVHSAEFTRVLRNPESRSIVNSIFNDTRGVQDSDKPLPSWKNGDNNVWLAGGWCWDGLVLLEGCVVSAMRVADAFDVEIPWKR